MALTLELVCCISSLRVWMTKTASLFLSDISIIMVPIHVLTLYSAPLYAVYNFIAFFFVENRATKSASPTKVTRLLAVQGKICHYNVPLICLWLPGIAGPVHFFKN